MGGTIKYYKYKDKNTNTQMPLHVQFHSKKYNSRAWNNQIPQHSGAAENSGAGRQKDKKTQFSSSSLLEDGTGG